MFIDRGGFGTAAGQSVTYTSAILSKDHAIASRPFAELLDQGLTAMKILVADDEQLTRQLTAALLKLSIKADVSEAENGDVADQLIQSNEFDLLLLDWNMPGKSGLDITRSLKAKQSQVPVIMVSSNAQREMVLEALQAGVADYVIKPFQPEYLLAKVSKFIPAQATG